MPVTPDAFRVYPDQFPGLHVADKIGPQKLQGAGLAGHHITLLQPADGKGAQAVAVPAGVESFRREDHGGEGSVQLVGGREDFAGPVTAGYSNQEGKQFAVGGGPEQVPPGLDLLPDAACIDNVSVVGQGKGAVVARHQEGLDVLQSSDITGRIAYMANGGGSVQLR